LKTKILFSSIIVVLGFVLFFVAASDNYGIITIVLSLSSLACAVRLGLLGKQLIDVILPGSYPIRRAKMPVKETNDKVVAPAQ
jgi:hypothetical protein